MVFAAEFWCPTKALLMRQQLPPISRDKAVDFFLPIFSMVKYDSEYPKKYIYIHVFRYENFSDPLQSEKFTKVILNH